MADRRARDLVGRFECRGSDGATYTVVEFQHYLISETLDAPPERVDLLREYRTSDGRHVKRLSDNEFEMLDPIAGEVRLRRSAPHSPVPYSPHPLVAG